MTFSGEWPRIFACRRQQRKKPDQKKDPPPPDPVEMIKEAMRNAGKPAARTRRPRRAAPARRLPHGGCTGVWIPREVYEDPRFDSFNEMMLYLEINYLDKKMAARLGISISPII
jgi:hypothetical protein